LDRRVSAKIIDHFVLDLTPASEFEKLKNRKALPGVYRERGMGRPTKRERRVLEKFQDQDTDQVQDL
jgi:ribosome-associated heat shock protein Hsp15